MNTAALLSALLSGSGVLSGCDSGRKAAPTIQAAVKGEGPGAAAIQDASATTQASMSVDDLVAPIALYPDQLLAQVLAASTNSQEVLDGGNWLLQNQKLKGDALTKAAEQAGFSPPMQYLFAFPQVVDNMCQQIDWTRDLGEAFQADQQGVMNAVQRKRDQAQQAGNLKSGPQMSVSTEKADNGQQYIEIKPADPKIVYVPEYNPVTIYNVQTVAAPAPAVTTTEQASGGGVSTGTAVAIGLLSFGVGMAIGSTFHNNNYYPYPAWGYGRIYYGGRPYYPPPYRPVYPGYRPAYGYHPPPNYHWTQYNRNVNVNVNNNNYYGRYNKPSQLPATAAGTQGGAGNNRPGNQGWKGQSTYQGARPSTTNQKPGAGMATAIPRDQQTGNRSNYAGNAARPNAGGTPASSNRPTGGVNTASVDRPNYPGKAGAGSNAGSRDAARPSAGSAGVPSRNSGANTANLNRSGDRGYAATPSTRPANTSTPGAGAGSGRRPQPQNRAPDTSSAFSKGGSAKSERAASSRGQASSGVSGNRGHGGAGGRGAR